MSQLPPTGQTPITTFSSFEGAQRFERDFFSTLQPYTNISHANHHIQLTRTILSAVLDTNDNPHVNNTAIYLGTHAAFSELDAISAITDLNNSHRANTDAQSDLARIRRDRANLSTNLDTIRNASAKHSDSIAALNADIARLRHERHTILTECNTANTARDLARADHDQHTIEPNSLANDLDHIRNERGTLITERDQLVTELDCICSERATLITERTQAQSNYNDIVLERDNVHRDLTRIQDINTNTTTEHTTLQNDLARIRHERDTYFEECKNAQFKLIQAQEQSTTSPDTHLEATHAALRRTPALAYCALTATHNVPTSSNNNTNMHDFYRRPSPKTKTSPLPPHSFMTNSPPFKRKLLPLIPIASVNSYK
ncbi:hypothetical protein SARC_05946 [Sphaeroforma arctica JP610]|uniref:Uncharacterized protein n=1 Tax=Sphaeroforma arctica JP610 TaxID=667725 RepID=A0A0L0FYN8_9EUKA|nr:hypothetical protein SARC_05946 [Sphaeroforma arctica JP610]KNC81744.1 hypothetical protein SARC_05946 [Sphaeroforma arctica JP610]|eukprot:XP_014155646.1 hypothetical protein SARC_05946 [Sphaeroforma arctica JP610]